MAILTAAAILAGVTGLAKAGLGIGQTIKGKRLETDVPDLVTPQQEFDVLSLLNQNLRSRTLPGETQFRDEQRVTQSAALDAAKESARSSSDLMFASAAAQSTKQSNDRKFAIQEASLRERQLNNLVGQKRRISGFERENQIQNQINPAIQQNEASRRLKESGLQNLFGGLDSIAATGIGLLGASNQDQYLNQLEKLAMSLGGGDRTAESLNENALSTMLIDFISQDNPLGVSNNNPLGLRQTTGGALDAQPGLGQGAFLPGLGQG